MPPVQPVAGCPMCDSSDLCPFCEAGHVSMQNPMCDNCGYEVDLTIP
jgi:hypothetical protein